MSVDLDKRSLALGNKITLSPGIEIDLSKMKCKDYYSLFMEATGFRKWSNCFVSDVTKTLKLTGTICKDT